MNHCLIQALVNSAPQMRYTKENQTPIAEMTVNFKGLRSEDPIRELKVLGWGSIAQEMIEEHLPAPGSDSVVIMCGPPPMIQYACKANLDKIGFPKADQLAF